MTQFECGYMSSAVWIGPGATSILPCCYTSKAADRNKHRDMGDILNHQNLLDVRRDAMKGIAHEFCLDCVYKEKNGMRSPRLEANKFFANKGKVKEYITEEDIEHIYFSLSNLCNFKCVICSSGQSHLIAKEEKIQNPLMQISDAGFDKLLAILDKAKNLKKLQISGGEPFQHKKQLKKVLSAVPKDINFYLHTNGSILDDETIELCKIMETFYKSSVSFSIDGWKNSFDYQRTNGEWYSVRNNLQRFNDLIDMDKVWSVNNYTVTCFNLLDIPEFTLENKKFFKRMYYYELKKPSEYHISMLKDEYLEKAKKGILEIQKTFTPHELNYKILLNDIVKAIDLALDNPPSQSMIDAFWKKTKYMEVVRGVSLQYKLPGLIECLRGWNG